MYSCSAYRLINDSIHKDLISLRKVIVFVVQRMCSWKIHLSKCMPKLIVIFSHLIGTHIKWFHAAPTFIFSIVLPKVLPRRRCRQKRWVGVGDSFTCSHNVFVLEIFWICYFCALSNVISCEQCTMILDILMRKTLFFAQPTLPRIRYGSIITTSKYLHRRQIPNNNNKKETIRVPQKRANSEHTLCHHYHRHHHHHHQYTL